jgi:hypothetical protein
MSAPDKRAGRPADLIPASAKGGHQESADNRGVKSPSRRNARCDRDRHRQGNGNDRNRERRRNIAAKAAEIISFEKHGNELGPIEMGCGGTVWHRHQSIWVTT